MVDDAEELAELLSPAIDGAIPELVEIPGSANDVALAIRIDPIQTRTVWRKARSRLDVTGRWPVAVTGWDASETIDWPLVFRDPERFGSPPEILDRARTLDETEIISSIRDRGLHRMLEDELTYTARRYGAAPSVDEAVRALGNKPSWESLERWLFEWEVERFPKRPEWLSGYLDWFTPDQYSGPTMLLFLPTAKSEESLAYIPFYAEDLTVAPEQLVALVRDWGRRFGAELAANWGTMLQFEVTRPPATLDEAWQLAIEQDRVAPSTTGLPGVTVRDHARALLGRDTWFLHERP